MSFIIVPNVAEKAILDQLIERWGLVGNPRVLLFTNNITPDESTVRADFVQPTNAGYSGQSLGAWSAANLTPDGEAYTVSDEVTITCSGGAPVTVYGYFADDDGSPAKLLWAQRFDSPRTFGPSNPVTFGVIFKLRQIPIP